MTASVHSSQRVDFSQYPSLHRSQSQGHNSSNSPDASQITPEQEKEVAELKKRDAAVRRHEQAHLAAAGPFAGGGASFEYTTGPDGRRYAVAGEVSVDTSAIPDDPQKTIEKARVIRRAALAPEQPSGQDRQVAAKASRMEAEARRELARKSKDEPQSYDQSGSPTDNVRGATGFSLTA